MNYIIFLVPFIVIIYAKHKYKEFNVLEMFVTCCITFLIFLGLSSVSGYFGTTDIEIWNGKVTSKESIKKDCPNGWTDDKSWFCRYYETREVLDYIEIVAVYDSKGNQTGTKEVKHYKTEYKYDYPWEQNWIVNTTLQEYEISRVDKQGNDEPSRWTIVKENDPVSNEHLYVNYIKAVPDSIFNNKEHDIQQFNQFIPNYPTISDYYKINRVLTVLYQFTDRQELNRKIGDFLGEINPRKQVNFNLILTSIKDRSFKLAVENAWIGGKKNDVTLFIGLDDSNILWTDVMTFGLNDSNGVLVSNLSAEVLELKTINNIDKLVYTIETNIEKHFHRAEMKNYEYLKDEIEIPVWLSIICMIVNLGLSVGMIYMFRNVDFNIKFWRKKK